tara:strand:+ start:313 stop:447 length:135 start_codon:yes stop_codon:yes gene_type:complete
MKDWEMSFGFVPGIIFGIRTYAEEYKTNYVLYFVCVDVCVTIHK